MKLTKQNLRRIILQEMSNYNRSNQQFNKAQRTWDAMTPPDGQEPPSASATAEEMFDVLMDYGYMEEFIEYAIDDQSYLYVDDIPDSETGSYDITDHTGATVARYLRTGQENIWGGPELELEVVDEARLTAALKDYFLDKDSNLVNVYEENYDEIILQQYSNDY